MRTPSGEWSPGSSGRDGAISPLDVHAVLSRPERITAAYQPVLDVRNARTAGWAVLARFDDGDTAPPNHWFRAAYGAGLGFALELTVLRRLLPSLRLRVPGIFIALHVTPQALGRPEVEALLMSEAPLHGLVLKLAGYPVAHTSGSWERAVSRLRAHGVVIAVDCVGAGFAEITQLLALRPQIIKVDRRVASLLPADRSGHALLRHLGELGDALDAWVMVEGVEQPAQLEELRSLGVPLAQGWLIGRPSPIPTPCDRGLTGTASQPAPERDVHATRCRPRQVMDVMRPVRVLRTRFGRSQPSARPAASAQTGTTGRDDPGWTVQVDVAGVPIAVGRAELLTCPRQGQGILQIPPDLAVPAAASRAMARNARTRFDPLVCVTPTGQVIGVVVMEDLILSLADSRDLPPAEPPPRRRGSPVVIPQPSQAPTSDDPRVAGVHPAAGRPRREPRR